MIIFKNLKQILEMVIQWENRLTEFYTVAENLIKDDECKKLIALLKENHVHNLNIIKDTRIENYGLDEWIRCADDCNADDLLPIDRLTIDTTKEEMITPIVKFEEKMKGFYVSISEKIVSRNEKELIDALVVFKERQIYEIKKCLD